MDAGRTPVRLSDSFTRQHGEPYSPVNRIYAVNSLADPRS